MNRNLVDRVLRKLFARENVNVCVTQSASAAIAEDVDAVLGATLCSRQNADHFGSRATAVVADRSITVSADTFERPLDAKRRVQQDAPS